MLFTADGLKPEGMRGGCVCCHRDKSRC